LPPTARTLTSAVAYEDDAVKWKQALASLDLGQ
jgi:hypothetical protein